jgi:hypothetical protein
VKKISKSDLKEFCHGAAQGFVIMMAACLIGFFLTAPFWN